MIAIWFLVISIGRGAVIVPAPYSTRDACMAQAVKINRNSSEGGMPDGNAYCVEAEAKKASGS